jgi:hypothetical protein
MRMQFLDGAINKTFFVEHIDDSNEMHFRLDMYCYEVEQ